ncbi:WD40/YVTN/BNR-like repeat-containing protein [Fodinicola acaciae]|uniref:WD40/YVTN/BNR-like repeat-containing protein n=1 Tax=Fodinicola acaciae TaxID=2681555 RepID=UPI0013D017C4|nr:sialidase family protein [Fodinicola acaciae]
MNQLDATGARDYLDEQMVQPDFSVIAAQGRRKRVRGWLAALAAAVAAALAAIVVVPLGTAPAVGLLGATEVCRVLPVSKAISYLVLGNCTDSKDLVLARTWDNGRHWDASRMPDFAKVREEYGGDIALDPDTVVLTGCITQDAGRSWQPVNQQMDTAIETVPSGWAVVPATFYTYKEAAHRLVTIDPATGRLHPLAHQPLAPGDGHVTEAGDGSLWLSPGWSPGTTAVSRDRGRSWKDFAPAGKGAGWSSLASVDGVVGYAVFTDQRSGRTVIYRTADGGAFWQQWSTPSMKSLGWVQLLPNGDLLALSSTNGISGSPMVRSSDQGRTFTAQFPTQLFFALDRLPSGEFRADGFQGHGTPPDFKAAASFVSVSDDGSAFVPLHYPPGARFDWQKPTPMKGSPAPTLRISR